jgi:hypothetical protein
MNFDPHEGITIVELNSHWVGVNLGNQSLVTLGITQGLCDISHLLEPYDVTLLCGIKRFDKDARRHLVFGDVFL